MGAAFSQSKAGAAAPAPPPPVLLAYTDDTLLESRVPRAAFLGCAQNAMPFLLRCAIIYMLPLLARSAHHSRCGRSLENLGRIDAQLFGGGSAYVFYENDSADETPTVLHRFCYRQSVKS